MFDSESLRVGNRHDRGEELSMSISNELSGKRIAFLVANLGVEQVE